MNCAFYIVALFLFSFSSVGTQAGEERARPKLRGLNLNSSEIESKRTVLSGAEPQVSLQVYFTARVPAAIAEIIHANRFLSRYSPVSVDGKQLVDDAKVTEVVNKDKELVGIVLTLKKKSDAERLAKALARDNDKKSNQGDAVNRRPAGRSDGPGNPSVPQARDCSQPGVSGETIKRMRHVSRQHDNSSPVVQRLGACQLLTTTTDA